MKIVFGLLVGMVLFSVAALPTDAQQLKEWVDHVPMCDTFNPLNESRRVQQGLRPKYEYSIASKTLPLVVHAMKSTNPDYAARILSYAEISWKKIVVEMNFRAPLPDQNEDGDERTDIYIRSDLPAGVGGYTGFSGFNERTPETDAYGYLVIADQLSDVYIRGVVAHEFFHLSQMAYDWFEHPGFMEATAVWVTDHVFDSENFYWKYYRYYNANPTQALDRISLADPYQYGAGLWFQFLDEHFGRGDGQFIRQLWMNSMQNTMSNEPDYFDSMRVLLGGVRGLNQAFREFGRWRLAVGSRAGSLHLRESSTWSDRVIPSMIELGAYQNRTSMPWQIQGGLHPYSHAFLRLTSVPEDVSLKILVNQTDAHEIYAEEIHKNLGERIFILARVLKNEYHPSRSPDDAPAVSGIIENK